MRRAQRIKLLAIAATSACIALHVTRCGCCGLCGQPAAVASTVVPQQLPSLPGGEPATIRGMLGASETVAGGGLRLPGWMVWGGSPFHNQRDGVYHLFFSRWEERLGHNAWVTSSEVAHAVALSPHGPWRLRDVALPRRGRHFWDGMATHNPTVHYDQRRRQYVLFYIGTTFDFELPADGPLTNRTLYELAWNSKRIGVATSPSLDGPWSRLSSPILHPRPERWDGGITSNPAATILPNGSTLLFYKSIAVGYPERNLRKPKPVFHIGAAIAETSVLGPYRRLREGPALVVNGTAVAAEDPYVWYTPSTGRLHLIFKAMQPVRRRDPQKSLVVPGGWLAYTHTAAGCLAREDCLETWELPQIAFNRTLVVRDDDDVLDAAGRIPPSERAPWWRRWLPLAAETDAPPGLPAVTSAVHRLSHDRKRAREGDGGGAGSVPVAHAQLSTLPVDRLERKCRASTAIHIHARALDR